MKTSLHHITTIQTGVFARTVTKGGIVYLQSRHFDEAGQLTTDLYPDVKAESINQKHLLQPGDVLFSAKGTKNFAVLYESKNPPAIASTSFFVIRLLPEFSKRVLPGYLVWFINHSATQNFLKGKARGTSLLSISKATLQELVVQLPTVETQRIILEVDRLKTLEVYLKKRLDALREQHIQHVLLQSATE